MAAFLKDTDWSGRRVKKLEPEEDRESSGKIKQSHLELELLPSMGEGVRLGTVALAVGGARPGGYPR